MKRIMKIYVAALLLVISIGLPGRLYAENIEAQLPSSDGSDGFQVKDSGGTPLMHVDSSGDVGIGTITPVERLQVEGNIKVLGETFREHVDFKPSGPGDKWIRIGFSNQNNGSRPLHLYVTRSESWDNSTPSGGPTLELTCLGRESSSGQQYCTALYGYHGTSGAGITHIAIKDNGAGGSFVYLRLAGNVTYKFWTADDSGTVILPPQDNATGAPDISDPDVDRLYSLNQGVNVIGDNGNNLYVSGNMGIGTVYPAFKLDVSGQANATQLCIDGVCKSAWDQVGTAPETDPTVLASVKDGVSWDEVSLKPGDLTHGSGSTNYLSKWTGTYTLSTSLIYDDGTNVGIGTITPGYKLDVAGGLRVAGDLDMGSGINRIINLANPSSLQDAATKAYVDNQPDKLWSGDLSGSIYNNNAGNVGIGTTNPIIGKLVIADDGTATSDLRSTLRINNTRSGLGASVSSRMLLSGNDIAKWEIANDLYQNGGQDFYIYDDVAGLARFFINSSGNVGIGTTSPGVTLDVAGGIRADYQQGFSSRYSTGGVSILSKVDTGTFGVSNTIPNINIFGPSLNGFELGNTAAGISGRADIPGSISIFTAGSERLRIDSGGNVGIGTTSPFAGSTWASPGLEVSGSRGSLSLGTTNINGLSTLRFKGPTTNSEMHLNFSDGANPALTLYSYSGGGYMFTLKGDGNVGIGTETPEQKLQVMGNLAIGTHTAADNITFERQGTFHRAAFQELHLWEHGYGDMVTFNNGNVYINNGGSLCLSGDCRSSWPGGVDGTGTPNYLTKWTALTTVGSSLIFDNGNNVGIGTNNPASGRLQFANELGNKIVVWDTGVGNIFGLGLNNSNLNVFIPSASKFSVRTGDYNGAEQFVVTGSGSVGIGTTNPWDKLTVVGNISVDGNIGASGYLSASNGAAGIFNATDLKLGGRTLSSARALVDMGNKLQINYAGDFANGVEIVGPTTLFGNVGIDTTDPEAKLIVASTSTVVSYSAIRGRLITPGAQGRAVWGSVAKDANGDVQGHAGYFAGRVYINCPSGVSWDQNIGSCRSLPGWGDAQYALYVEGNAYVNGTLAAKTKTFRIDHPLDPENKHLIHASIESSDMKNLYDGITILNESGEAWVELPNWFEALNKDFRYQLTSIGGFAPVYIAEEISNNRFKIAGGQPGMKVSWQVTGIRHDTWAEANPMKVEVDK